MCIVVTHKECKPEVKFEKEECDVNPTGVRQTDPLFSRSL